MIKISTCLRGACALLLAGSSLFAQAQETYIVEVVLFSQPGAQIVAGPTPDPEWDADAASLDSTTRSEIRPIDRSRYSLDEKAAQLTRQGYKVSMHKAWTQPANGSTVAVHEGEGDWIYSAQGLVSLSQERPLETEVTFWINHATAGAEPVSERLQQRRRLRLEETHYLDHQSMGMLIRVMRN